MQGHLRLGQGRATATPGGSPPCAAGRYVIPLASVGGETSVAHPLHLLASMCVCQPICHAVRDAAAAMAFQKPAMEQLGLDYYDGQGPFFETFLLIETL